MDDKKDKAAKLSGTQEIVSVKSERFDYTQWRKGLFKDKSSEEIIEAAAKYEGILGKYKEKMVGYSHKDQKPYWH